MSAAQDRVFTNTTEKARDEYLNELDRMRVEDPEPLDKAEQLLEHRRFELVMRMTSVRFAKLTHAEKRNYLRWAKHFSQVFSEKYSLFTRHTPADIDTPTYLRQKEA